MTDDTDFTRYELRSIDAWRDPEGGWTWNNSFHIESGIFIGNEVGTRGLLKYCREGLNILTNESKGRVRVYDDGDIIEIQARGTGEPLFAFIPEPTEGD